VFLGHNTPTLGGYLTVFTICGCGALVAALLLFLVPKLAFADDTVLQEPTPHPPANPKNSARP
jgi:hypothetical protein